jgi:hypothetical protein
MTCAAIPAPLATPRRRPTGICDPRVTATCESSENERSIRTELSIVANLPFHCTEFSDQPTNL